MASRRFCFVSAHGSTRGPAPADGDFRRSQISDHVPVLAARISLAVVALVACAWFALGIRQAHDLGHAVSIVTSASVSPGQAAHAESLLNAAGALNPDVEVKLVRAELALRQGDARRAVALAAQAAKDEPQNVLTWDGSQSSLRQPVRAAGRVQTHPRAESAGVSHAPVIRRRPAFPGFGLFGSPRGAGDLKDVSESGADFATMAPIFPPRLSVQWTAPEGRKGPARRLSHRDAA